MTTESDPIMHLFKQAVEGDSAALNELAATLRPMLRVFAAKKFPAVVSSREDPSDVTQNAFFGVLRTLHDFRGSTKEELIAWAIGKVSAALSELREKHIEAKKRSVRREGVCLDSVDSFGHPTADDSAASAPLREKEELVQKFADLPELEKCVLTLLYIDGFTPFSAAELLLCSIEEIEAIRLKAMRRVIRNSKKTDPK